jgi:ABC-type multidrug transport system ATPase subunit
VFAVEISGVTVRRGDRRILSAVDLVVPEGITALLGPNGSGKTTLLRTLVNDVERESGSVSVYGHDFSSRSSRSALPSTVGYLPQTFDFWPHFTVRETLLYVAWIKGVPRRDRVSEAQRVGEALGLGRHMDARMKTLSGGTVRRVGIAQAMLGGPRLLLLDEPAAGLDPAQRGAMREAVVALAAQGRSVVLSTHLVDDLADYCRHVVVLRGGRVAFSGTTSAFLRLGGDPLSGGTAEAAYAAAMLGPAGGSRAGAGIEAGAGAGIEGDGRAR